MTRSVSIDMVGMEELEESITFNVFPNPNNGIFNLSLSDNIEGAAKFTVLDAVGNILLTTTVSNLNNVQINLSGVAAGFYFIRLESVNYSSAKSVQIIR